MRPPRYRFPDEVRTATREMAARTARAGTIARTPEELDAWITAAPDVREPLERGGYAAEFTADDLYPLYAAMVGKAGGPPLRGAAGPAARSRWIPWMLAAIALAVVVALVLVAVRGA